MRDLTLVYADTPASRNAILLRSVEIENKYAFDLYGFAGEHCLGKLRGPGSGHGHSPYCPLGREKLKVNYSPSLGNSQRPLR